MLLLGVRAYAGRWISQCVPQAMGCRLLLEVLCGLSQGQVRATCKERVHGRQC